MNNPHHDYRNYNLQVLHLCCAHDFIPTDYLTSPLSFSQEFIQPKDPEQHIRYVTDPRWCLECSEWRRQAITMSFEARLAVLPPEDRERLEEFCIHRQFVKGVRDGRVWAIFRPLEESLGVGEQEVSDPAEYVADAVRELEGMGLVDGTDESLAGMMGEAKIERTRMEDGLDRAFREMQAYDMGVKAGRGAQALLESQALGHEDAAVRRDLFEQALL
jgi:hypothetical protein